MYTYVDFHNHTKSTFDKLYRVDTRDYPEIALREALLNLLVHRDYSFRSSSFISIFTDRIEFISVGGLLPGIALNDVLLGMSICRNPNLANVFYRLQLIEAYGTGIQKIMNAYKGCKKTPRIETSDNAFKIILPNSNYLQIEKENSEEHVILDYLKQNEIITRPEVEKMLEVGTTTAYRILKRMTENGILTQYGKGKNTKYKKLPC